MPRIVQSRDAAWHQVARTMPRMPKLPMRVAMLSSECEPWAKTGGLADVVDALARALGGTGRCRGRSAGRCLPAALSRGARAGDRGAHPRAPCPGPALAVGQQPDHRPRRRRRTGIGCDWSTIRPHSIATGSTATPPATTPTTRGGSGCSAGRRWRPSGPTAGRRTCSTCTMAHGCRGHLPRQPVPVRSDHR